MKVLAFNCSPSMDKGNTALIFNPFVEGMKEAGAEVELFYTNKLKINFCTGQVNCWFKHPGKCYQDDDMNMLYPKLREADVWVFATPVYWDGVTGPMKTLIDRTALPLFGPFYELRDGHTRTIWREGTTSTKVVLVSVGGQWEMDIFDPLLVYMKAMCKNSNFEFAGALLRPHTHAVKPMIESGAVNDIFEAAKEAGRQLVKNGKMSAEILKTVSRELVPQKPYMEGFNQFIQQILDSMKKE
ncbi:flavodoxin family protein [Candidatus Borrarchaeum sp.]|uniref:flavodoxin family protein n=1 Tax=Candidatus Borrarchaeum sp. TaxID=2846742 RepID=UPI00257C69FC|nr:flavodoxin family protein [Candidatus Borrarchaeum sp.]